jgi:hypothetical protein
VRLVMKYTTWKKKFWSNLILVMFGFLSWAGVYLIFGKMEDADSSYSKDFFVPYDNAISYIKQDLLPLKILVRTTSDLAITN